MQDRNITNKKENIINIIYKFRVYKKLEENNYTYKYIYVYMKLKSPMVYF